MYPPARMIFIFLLFLYGQALWDGNDNQGRSLSSGLFMAQIRTTSRTEVIKLTLVR